MRRLADFLVIPTPARTSSDLAYTLNNKRSHFPWRVAINASTISELGDILREAPPKALHSPQVPRLGFIFTGQGAQWYAMGRELIYSYPIFAETLQEGGDYMRSLGAQWSPIEELTRGKEDTKLNHPYLSFPMSVLLQLALVRLLRSWRISPTATTGHSSGEIAAAYASGALTFEQAIAVAYIRGRLTSEFVSSGRAHGGMTAVAASREKVTGYLQAAEAGDQAVIACINSPSSVTISGNLNTLETIETIAAADNVLARRLKVPAAYHSTEMESLAEDYLNALKPHFDVSHPGSFDAAFSSPVTGGLVEGAEKIQDPSHWVRNMVQPVLFEDSLKAMIAGDSSRGGKNTATTVDMLIEIGPHGTLQGPVRQILDSMSLQGLKTNVGTCLKRGEDATRTMKEMAAMIHCRGYRVDLEKVNFPVKSRTLRVVHDLPLYQWNHSVAYWDAPPLSTDYMQRKYPRHDLLGARIEGLNPDQAIWRNTVRISDLPWLQHHMVQSEILYPAAGLMVMVTEAMRQLDHTSNGFGSGFSLSDIDLSKAIIIPNTQEGLEIQLVIRNTSSQPTDSQSIWDFVFWSRTRGSEWTQHCRGKVSAGHNQPQTAASGGLGHVPLDIEHFYSSVERTGPTLGSPFRNVTHLAGGDRSAQATITVPDTNAMMPSSYQSNCVVHPTTLDACFHPAWATLSEAMLGQLGLSVPRTIENLFISTDVPSTPGSELGVTVSLAEANREGFQVSLSVYSLRDHNRLPLIQIDGLRMVSISENPGTSSLDELALLHTVWQPSLNLLSASDLQSRITEVPNSTEVAVFDDLQKATVNVIHDALQQLTPEVEQSMEWYHAKYVSWMRDQDAVHYSAGAIQDEQEKSDLYNRVTSSCVNGRMLDLVAKTLPKFLRKEAEPLEVMSQNGFLSEYYANMIKLTRCLNHVEKYMKLFAHQNPNARILEVGAGTGSCTEPALRGLSQDNQAPLMTDSYVFTDVSAGFFELAGRRFEAFTSQMKFQKLDIERNPSEQGFGEGEFDLVISCNCLHATTSLHQTLRHVRKLLRPGGKLLLLETTTPHLDQSLTFGLFPGWWLSDEEERKSSPLLSAPRWSAFLEEAGFTGVDVALGDSGSVDDSNYSVMVATAAEERITNGSLHPKKIALMQILPSVETPQAWLESLRCSLNNFNDADASIIEAGDSVPDDTQYICVLAAGVDPLSTLTPSQFELLKQTMIGAEKVLWLSRGATMNVTCPAEALHIGLLRTLRMEQGGEKYISLDLDPEQETWQSDTIKAISKVFNITINSAHSDHQEYEFAQRAGDILVPRLHRNLALIQEMTTLETGPQPQDKSLSSLRPESVLEVTDPENTENVKLGEQNGPPNSSVPLPAGMVEIEPHVFGMNVSHVCAALDRTQDPNRVLEFAGYVTQVASDAPVGYKVGDRVCGLSPGGYFPSRIRVPSTAVVALPETMAFETAAVIPFNFLTAYHALVNIARLEADEVVLIHAGADGPGLAAIAIAKHLEGEIWTTVTSEEERQILIETYQIPGEHIFSSKDTSFGDVLEATNGKGVDVVFNSQTGPSMQAGWDCLSPLGRFVDIAKYNSHEDRYLDMKQLSRSVVYAAIDVVQLGRHKPKAFHKLFQQVMSLFEDNLVVPRAQSKVHALQKAGEDPLELQNDEHTEKVLVENEAKPSMVVPEFSDMQLDPKAAYLIVGGLTGIGREVVRWLANRGAKNLILISRSASQEKSKELQAEIHSVGAQLISRECDISKKPDLERVIGECRAITPIRGVVQSALVLDDSAFANMTLEQWNTPLGPKYEGTKNLDELFQGSSLDFFIMLSSVTGILGSHGQSNYTAGSTYQDALARNRVTKDLPAVSIDLGSVLAAGYVARTKGVAEHAAKAGWRTQTVAEVLRLVELAIRHPRQVEILAGISAWVDPGQLAWRRERRFAVLRVRGTSEASSKHSKESTLSSLRDRIKEATAETRLSILVEALTTRLADMFVLAAADINQGQPLSALGVDSLVAVELRNWLSANVTSNVTIFDVTQSSSLFELAEKVADKFLKSA
ncbi:hypothetical protein BJ170DRAFT_619322 [Xylariales sp. AK1849]|nr:hypothetical protein BJ170DRAFT_619322 [Xylariales sp. AK1849]